MENNLLQLAKGRRSIRKYSGQRVEIGKLEQLIEFARWAPSSCNRQTCFYVVITDPDVLENISYKKKVLESSATIVVLVDLSRYSVLKKNLAPFIDGGVAIENILLGGHSLGLGCCMMAGRLDEKLIKSVLKIPESYLVIALISVGYPDLKSQLPPPEKVPLNQLFSINSYKKMSATEGYKSIIHKREKWSRAGWDIRYHYRRPKEGTRIFDFAKWRINEILSNGSDEKDKILLTFSAFGYLLQGLNNKNYDCLVTSTHEKEFIIKSFRKDSDIEGVELSKENFDKDSLILLNPVELNKLSKKYKYIVSFFDIQFMSRNEIILFLNYALKRLENKGELLLTFFNTRSLFGLNYKLSRLFKKNSEFIREIGFEVPMKIKEVLSLIPDKNVSIKLETSMFLPIVNVGYLFEDMGKYFIWDGMGKFNWLRHMPFLKRCGNIVFLTIKNKASDNKR